MSEWTVAAPDAGARLDKFLAAPDRAGSRAKAVAALERGKVFVNDVEVTMSDAARRVAPGDVVRLVDGSAGQREAAIDVGDARDLPIVYEDDTLIVLNKPPGSFPCRCRSTGAKADDRCSTI
jgi:Pseudouridylate synthases, 23S RNA-specific